jgi:hypothetical protein
MRVGGQRHVPAALPPGKRLGTHFIEGWVWTGVKNLAPYQDSIPGPSIP